MDENRNMVETAFSTIIWSHHKGATFCDVVLKINMQKEILFIDSICKSSM